MPFRLPPFEDPELFQQAMTHKSYASEHPQITYDNERLEFLGDAILTFLCGEFLFQRYPDKAEGDLTCLRASLVGASQLSQFAEQLRLNQYLRFGRGVAAAGGRDNSRLLSSAFEALVGAYFLDQRSLVEPVRTLVFPLFESVVDVLADPAQNINEKSAFQQWSLAEKGMVPAYVIVSESGPDHDKRFTAEVRVNAQCYGRGTGRRKQDAEKSAARAALQHLGLID